MHFLSIVKIYGVILDKLVLAVDSFISNAILVLIIVNVSYLRSLF